MTWETALIEVWKEMNKKRIDFNKIKVKALISAVKAVMKGKAK